MDADDLLKTIPVLPYLEGVEEAGVGSSGVLHRILAHKAAVHFTEEEGGVQRYQGKLREKPVMGRLCDSVKLRS